MEEEDGEEEDDDDDEVGFIAAIEQWSLRRLSSSSIKICLHLHSTLQNALSPLRSKYSKKEYGTQKSNIRHKPKKPMIQTEIKKDERSIKNTKTSKKEGKKKKERVREIWGLGAYLYM